MSKPRVIFQCLFSVWDIYLLDNDHMVGINQTKVYEQIDRDCFFEVEDKIIKISETSHNGQSLAGLMMAWRMLSESIKEDQ